MFLIFTLSSSLPFKTLVNVLALGASGGGSKFLFASIPFTVLGVETLGIRRALAQPACQKTGVNDRQRAEDRSW